MMNQYDFVNSLNEHKNLQRLLYRRGYMFTNRSDFQIDSYPFYGNWKKVKIAEAICLYHHIDEHCYSYAQNDVYGVIIGHACNPFSGEYMESTIIKNIVKKYIRNKETIWDYINELTGVHVICILTPEEMMFVQDCTGMKSCYYGRCENDFFITSHCQLVKELVPTKDNKNVQKLIRSYSYNHNGSMYLPGDYTVLEGFYRLGPNTALLLDKIDKSFRLSRFYPVKEHPETTLSDQELLEYIASILSKTIDLCLKKWNKPAISLSGGVDSRMSFAASSHCSDRMRYYSYYCKESELLDAKAAHDICQYMNVHHSIYEIEKDNGKINNFELYKEIIYHGTAYMHLPKDHEIRKFITFSTFNDFDVELRSYASEVGRAHWGKRFGMDLPKKLTEKDFNIFQTRYLFQPYLMHMGEKMYKQHMEKIHLKYPMYNYDMQDLFYWEYRFGSYDVLATEMMEIYQFDATIPMNNRKLLDLCLYFPYEARKSDSVYLNIIKINEPKLSTISNIVHDTYFSKKRVIFERLYYKYRTIFVKR